MVMTADKTAMETNNETESSDILIAQSSSDRATTSSTFYTRDNSRPHFPASRVRSGRYEHGISNERGPRKNPLGSDGRPRRCMVCDSIWHYVNDCPEVKKLKSDYKKKKDDNRDHEKDHEVN